LDNRTKAMTWLVKRVCVMLGYVLCCAVLWYAALMVR